jgi:hypothetical protein
MNRQSATSVLRISVLFLYFASGVAWSQGNGAVNGDRHGRFSQTAEIELPAGMSNDGDDDESADPRGLPRVLDYDIRSVSRYTLSDTFSDHDGTKSEWPLGRAESREYQLGRYAKRPPSSPAEILRHYRRQLEVIGGRVTSQSNSGLTGRFVRGHSVVEVTLKVEGNGSSYELTTAGVGAQDGVTSVLTAPPRSGEHDRNGFAAAQVHQDAEPLQDTRSSAVTGFRMPSRPELWPPRATRGMAVLLVGPGVHRATSIRFGTSDGKIITRENARVRVRVPLIPTGNVPVTLIEANGSERLNGMFQVLDAPVIDAAAWTVPPCDSRPGNIADVNEISPQPVRPGQLLRLAGRSFDGATHVTFTVARNEVDPQFTGIPPDLIGIDFGAAGKARSAPRWLDTLAVNTGRSYGARASIPGECDPGNLSGYATIKVTGDREGVVCVPPLALSGPIGVWRPKGSAEDSCDT